MSKVEQLRKDLDALSTGYGLMSLTWKAEPVPKDQAFAAMKQVVDFALEKNVKAFFNVGEFYGPDYIMLKNFFEKYPELRQKVIVSCKGSMDVAKMAPLGKSDDVKKSVEICSSILGGYIDIYEVARIDESIVEEGQDYPYETFEALAEMVDNGFIGGVSLSEVTEKQIRAINKDWHKYLTCVEVELSLFSTQILHNNIAKTCGELGLIIIAYSPLGRGLLTGQITSVKDIPKGDFRLMLKRFHGDAMAQNLVLVQFLRDEIIAKRDPADRITLPQLALGWIKHNSNRFGYGKIIPIPSGSSVSKVTENFDENKAKITDAEFDKINEFLKGFTTVGDRYELA
ncbi:hypothetical protein TPHA_0D03090 [Tetrapisispora phaffii CBS 4417]|uniref:NADP-dependent oxidoreductase domain-containing protein n=1 Tax=Tetrapisispora phaffii (strain ATCC 24235 / CBS 4417 / NBRC 1672 / NRRL Y-8282 / UCD 70-5) TaxID=1071381 RepID=G8BSX4_TETPH|nr:hypothetical protein TPHA_0D03090 [Tetrapisispora phaffii CBS 4417]CCE62945.1 hypothetical protein TPHA_0D03090 [Tetrapisispora phaffii CBS 4417]